jgi:hypothetical protein
MRAVCLSLINRDHGRDFTDNRPKDKHPMEAVTSASLRFREHDIREHGPDLHRVALLLTGELPDIGLELETEPYDWERRYGIWNAVCFRESVVPYCERVFAIMVNAGLADQLEMDLRTVAGDTTIVIGTLTAMLMGFRENEHPPLATIWPDDGSVFEVGPDMCVIVALHVNYHDQRGDKPCWRVVRDARVTKTGVVVGEEEFNGFAGLQYLALMK